jgi:hypothetical protein
MGRAAPRLRHVLAVVVTCALFPVFVDAAEDHCRWYKSGAYFTEWLESDGQHGARIASHDPRWKLRDLGWHATGEAVCESCRAGQLDRAVLWLHGSGPRDLQELLSVDSVAMAMWPFPFQISGAKFHMDAEPVRALFARREGRARTVRIEFGDGRIGHVIASAVVDGCVSLFSILHASGATEVSMGDLADVESVIGLELYKPAPDPQILEHLLPPERRVYVPPHWSVEDVHRALKSDNR